VWDVVNVLAVKVCSRWVLILLFGQHELNSFTKLKAVTSV
jgi:hypothetical protein